MPAWLFIYEEIANRSFCIVNMFRYSIVHDIFGIEALKNAAKTKRKTVEIPDS